MLNYDLTPAEWASGSVTMRFLVSPARPTGTHATRKTKFSKSREFSNVRHWGSFTIMDQHLGSLSLYPTFNFSIHEWPRRESGSIKLLK